MRVPLWTAALWTCLSCGPAGTIDGEIRSDDSTSATTEEREDPVEMQESKPTCIEPTLTSLRAELFVPTCGECHSGATPAEGLDLTLEDADLRMRLMQPSAQSPSGLPLVTPGSTGASYLFLKIAVATPLIGDRMPRGTDPMSDCAIEAVRKWVRDGAN